MRVNACARFRVPDSVDAVELLGLNGRRTSASFYNTASVDLYLALGPDDVTVNDFTVRVPSGGFYELPLTSFSGVFTGRVSGIWPGAVGDGACFITEVAS